jgi:hypothetical protein
VIYFLSDLKIDLKRFKRKISKNKRDEREKKPFSLGYEKGKEER